MTHKRRASELTVEDIIGYSISKISEYSEMCEDPTEMLVDFMAKNILKQSQLLEILNDKLESVNALLENLLDK